MSSVTRNALISLKDGNVLAEDTAANVLLLADFHQQWAGRMGLVEIET